MQQYDEGKAFLKIKEVLPPHGGDFMSFMTELHSYQSQNVLIVVKKLRFTNHSNFQITIHTLMLYENRSGYKCDSIDEMGKERITKSIMHRKSQRVRDIISNEQYFYKLLKKEYQKLYAQVPSELVDETQPIKTEKINTNQQKVL